MIFNIKSDLRRKARQVTGGHLMELFETEVYLSTVKGIRVKLLHVISYEHNLKPFCGDVGNVLMIADTSEKCIVLLDLNLVKKILAR